MSAAGASAPRGPSRRRERVAARLPAMVAAGRAHAARGRCCASRRSTCRASGTTRRSRPCTCCTRACGRRCARSSTPRTRRRCGTCSRGPTRACSAPARSRCACPRRSPGSRPCRSPGRSAASSAGRRARGDRVRRARRRQPAVRVVLPGGARVRAVRAHGGARDAVLPARPARAHARADGAFALSGALALLTPLLRRVPARSRWSLWLLCGAARRRRAALPAIGALALVGLALLPLISAQGGHGTQWIGDGRCPNACRRSPSTTSPATPARRSGTAIELLVALPILAGRRARAVAHARAGRGRAPARAAARGSRSSPRSRAGGVLIPIVLVAFGADYLAPRNLVAAMIPVTALIAVRRAPRRRDRDARGHRARGA